MLMAVTKRSTHQHRVDPYPARAARIACSMANGGASGDGRIGPSRWSHAKFARGQLQGTYQKTPTHAHAQPTHRAAAVDSFTPTDTTAKRISSVKQQEIAAASLTAARPMRALDEEAAAARGARPWNTGVATAQLATPHSDMIPSAQDTTIRSLL